MKRRQQLLSYLVARAKTKSDINEHLEPLYEMVVKTNAQKIVELGTRDGNSTCALVIGAAQTGGHVISVDWGKGGEYAEEPPTWEALAETSKLINEKLALREFWTLIVRDDLEFAKEYDDEIDLLFIDTSHSYEQTKKELAAWGSKVINGGFIVIHDTISFPEQNKAILEFLEEHPLSDYVEHKNCNGLGIVIKQGRGKKSARAPPVFERMRLWKNGVASLVAQVESARAEIHGLKADKETLVAQVESARAEIHGQLEMAQAQLTQIKQELNDIRRSFGYKLMKFYASRLDRLFPDETFRGELRKIVTAYLRVLTEEGFGSFCKKALDKIGRGELRIIEPLDTRVVHGVGIGTDRQYPSAVLSATVRVGDLSDDVLKRRLSEFLADNAALEFPIFEEPVVSIVVVTYNKAYYTYQCLRSLLADSIPPHEVIIVDNASSDETSALLRKTRNIRVIANATNQFFVRGCDQGANAARGEFLLFLNNDAFVHAGCISSLVEAMASAKNIGAAGAKLVWRNGRLQEAGSIVWRDGRGLGYGRGDDPTKPEYCYTRDVDYCSAACLLVRRDIFEQLGGFDETFLPAYYEDTDLCMRIWKSGLRVVYDPLAVATHVEYAGSSFEAAKQLMEKQRPVFVAKHRLALERRLPFSQRNILRARDRKGSPSILVIDDCVPKPDEGSGFPRMYFMLKSMASLGYRVTLLPLSDATPKQPETDALTQMGVEVLWGSVGVRELLRSRQGAYDVVLISRPHNALLAMKLVRETNPEAQVVYDAEALYYRREQLRRGLSLPPVDPRFESEEAELSILGSADWVLCVSQLERKIIENRLGQKDRVIHWGHPHALNPTTTPFERRSGLLFVGGFKSHSSPNEDAAIYFAKTMLPRIRERIPGCQLTVAGSNPPASVRRLASSFVKVTGYLKDLRKLYESCRIFVSPTRFAAGMMWKVTEAMSYGIPCVLSAVAAQGMEISDGKEALVASDEKDFIEKTLRLYQDETLWSRIRERELEYIAKSCDPAALEKSLDGLLKQFSKAAR